jgi:DNA-binding response OmpR family regulator
VTKILIVEDEPELLELLADEFTSEGFHVSTAKSGEEALEVLETAPHLDALVADIRLPGTLNGWDVAERFRDAWPVGLVTYVTAFSHVDPRPVLGGLVFRKPCRVLDIVKVFRPGVPAGFRPQS